MAVSALPFKIPKTGDPAILTQTDQGPFFYDTLHKHEDHQVTFIARGAGTLICGEYLGRFEAGDVFFFGSNQPHVLKCDEAYYHPDSEQNVRMVSIFFQDDSLGSRFLELNESRELKKFLIRARYGMKFSGKVKIPASELLEKSISKQGISLIVIFLELIDLLMSDPAPEYLSRELLPSMNDDEGQRMNAVVQYTLNHFKSPIGIDEISSVANMASNSFCRYFKLRTRKTYLNYLNEIRIAHACQLLQKDRLSVSQVAHLSGFKNLAHFNRSFKKVMQVTPGKYGRRLR